MTEPRRPPPPAVGAAISDLHDVNCGAARRPIILEF